jgi:group II intron reverse transcriptase/maturase
MVLSLAWLLLKENKGSRTPGVDGVTAKAVKEQGAEEWLTGIQDKLRTRRYEPQPIRRKWIPKPSKPGKMRPLGIPTLEDRLVQMALKLVLEPIYEAHFKGCSFGFRPNRGPWNAIRRIKHLMTPHFGYGWVIEADLKSCFDNIPHGPLLHRMRQRVQDKKILALVKAFLKAGTMEQKANVYPVTGSPQGGILSPLLANIYLDQLDEYYHQQYHSLRSTTRNRWFHEKGKAIIWLVRYADDFVLIVRGTRTQADEALAELRTVVQDTLKMELAEEKTGIRSLEEGFEFLGFRLWRGISHRTHKTSTVILPMKEAENRFRRKVKELTRRKWCFLSLDQLLERIQRLIRGWGDYFRIGWISRIYRKLDDYVFQRVWNWLCSKHQGRSKGWVWRRYIHRDLYGRKVLRGRKRTLLKMSRICRPVRRLGKHSENIPTPWDETTKQTTFKTGMKLVDTMEKLLYRHQNWGRAVCGESRTHGSGSSRRKRPLVKRIRASC